MMKKLLSATSGTDRNRGPTAFPSVSAYPTMMKKIIDSHFWYSQEQEPYSVSFCEGLSNNDEKHYCQPLLVRTGTGALQRFPSLSVYLTMMKKLWSATFGTDRNGGTTAFPSVSAYLTMMKNIIVSHFW
ncbi:hypothetical protein CDAR_477721 [Caerostris darwini]|uniref:Uncharacterized protein n=1 Tax=Caerostris darwini TaxID=1538125 RepID=A0AAV4MDR6_9ARAC|nr:hypothetical protein CDAR_477721 [Caerostris darwini]